MACVYIIRDSSGCFKVGIAKDPFVRLAALQTGNSKRLELVSASDVGYDGVDARSMERDMHQMLACFRIGGEWFNAPLVAVHRAFRIAWVRALYPAVIPRWERMCWRPDFVKRFAGAS